MHFEPDFLHSMVTDLKQLLHLNAGPVCERLAPYPPSPTNLPEMVYRVEYPDGGPITKNIGGFAGIAAKIPLRVTNNAIAAKARAVLQQGHTVDQLQLMHRQHGQPRLKPHQMQLKGISLTL